MISSRACSTIFRFCPSIGGFQSFLDETLGRLTARILKKSVRRSDLQRPVATVLKQTERTRRQSRKRPRQTKECMARSCGGSAFVIVPREQAFRCDVFPVFPCCAEDRNVVALRGPAAR